MATYLTSSRQRGEQGRAGSSGERSILPYGWQETRDNAGGGTAGNQNSVRPTDKALARVEMTAVGGGAGALPARRSDHQGRIQTGGGQRVVEPHRTFRRDRWHPRS
ncbi:hypothetical protein XFLAVUS301_44260 [Xanthobacter flavus]|uniref:Uncharacterized protein n=1 Tax=Xanthobacter flavus TaxID=281 RepID=A0A9W6FNR8_XANFL|nr:hypothetical protein XFLAVUS301_44260 [Xanthobacter flavus]